MHQYKRLIILCGILLLSTTHSYTQCDGNIGQNIFDQGDFGSGVDNILQTDPNIAPGYQYTTDPPPFDGFYFLTNNTGGWSDIFDGWLSIEDNSSDPNGYMMVVNASFDAGLFYQEEVTGLCENTGYEFSVDIINMIEPNSGLIKPNVSFLIDDVLQFSTGNIEETGAWETFGFSFETGPNQTSIVLSLSNNADGGIGNDLALDNITFRPCGPEALILPETVDNICEDGDPIIIEATIIGNQYDNPQYQWQQSFDEGMTWVDLIGENGMTYTHTDLNGGFYYYRYVLANSPAQLLNARCRVFSNTKIIYVQPKYYTVYDTICEGNTYTLVDQIIEAEGVYIDSLLTTLGCDSVVTVNLSVVADPGITADIIPIDPDCWYSETGGIIAGNAANGYPPYTILIDGITTPDLVEVTVSPGLIPLMIVDRHGCTLSQEVPIILPDQPTLDIGPDLEISLGDQVTLTPITDMIDPEYSANIDYTCNSDCTSIEIQPLNSMQVIFTVTDSNNCSTDDTLYIQVNKDRKVFIPNIISPATAGNETFYVQGSAASITSILSLQIYDRWGSLIYQCQDGRPNDKTCGWDGTLNDQRVQSGVYVYYAEVEFIDGESIVYTGDLTVVR